MSNDFRWSSAGVTDVGKVRKINEDNCLDLSDNGLWVVADGMGGHEAGDVASRMIVESLGQVGDHERLSAFVDEVEDRLLAVNGQLMEIAEQREEAVTIGSTVVALLAVKQHCVCVWAGDSRAYRYRDDVMRPITQDHSQVEEMIAMGELLREDAEDHPAANVITRAVGASDPLYLEMELLELQDGDRFLLCSDGLYKELTEAEIGEELPRGSCAEVCDRLVQTALERGSRDNVTVMVVQFEEIH